MPALDHVFVCCSVGATAEAEALARLGLTEGTPNTHPGQGTASRRFFFASAYLELFWVDDAEVAQAPLARPTRLWERWSQRGTGACPFAVITRPEHPSQDPSEADPPYRAWAYRPPYLPPPLAIHVAEDTPLAEPALFHIGFARPPGLRGDQPRSHGLGVDDVTGVTIALTGSAALSPAARAVEEAGLVRFERAEAFLMTLGFDGGAAGRSADLRPEPPLVLRW
jgi:hypothetical protein